MKQDGRVTTEDFTEENPTDIELSPPGDDDSLDSLFDYYSQTKDKKTLNTMVKRLNPTVSYTLASLGVANDPVMQAEARVVVANAIPNYDPSYGAKLPTYITTQLQQMHRTVRQHRSPIKVPERLQMDAYRLNEVEKEFMELHDREPDLLELSDKSGLSIRRIKRIRDQIFKSTGDETFGEVGGLIEPDFLDEALEYVYHDLDYKDKKILEGTTGFGGAKQLTPAELSAKLDISQSQVSRRTAKIALRIQEIAKALEPS